MASSLDKKKTSGNPLVSEIKIEETSDFRAEIEKSRAMIEGADQKVEPPKNKGGRPSKLQIEAKKLADAEAQAKVIEQTVPKDSLKHILALPFNLAAMQTGFEGFALTDQEADSMVPSMHTVLATYAPQVNGESMALMAFAGSLFSIAIAKYMAFINSRQGGQANTNSPSPGAVTHSSPDAALPAGNPIPVLNV